MSNDPIDTQAGEQEAIQVGHPDGSPQEARVVSAGGFEGSREGRGLPPDLDLPEDPGAAVDLLADAVVEARDTAAARLDDLQRVAAEFENYRKRAERERRDTVERATERLIEALLPVLDSFEGAFAHEAQTSGEELLKKGITSTFHQLMEILEREGLAAIQADEGTPFDPEVHEAVSGGAGDDLVISGEMRRGYTLRGRVLRPAMVAVAPASSREESDQQ